MDAKPLGEFELISKIAGQFPVPEGIIGIGDDCAILPQDSDKESLVSTDLLIEGTHFLLKDIGAYRLGWKSAAVNLSDLAAMGGKATGSFLSIAIPVGNTLINNKWMDDFIQGYKALSMSFHCPLLGGDTTRSEGPLCINVTVLGECPKGKAIRRNGARPGDIVAVSGFLGDAAAGLKLLLNGQAEGYLQNKHYLPLPKIKEGLRLAEDGVHAMMDISDGIGSDLRHILKASGVGACIDCTALPLSDAFKTTCLEHNWDALSLALCGGEDYELLFTAAPDTRISIPHSIIGRIVAEHPGEIEWSGSSKDYIGFRHF